MPFVVDGFPLLDMRYCIRNTAHVKTLANERHSMDATDNLTAELLDARAKRDAAMTNAAVAWDQYETSMAALNAAEKDLNRKQNAWRAENPRPAKLPA